MISFEPNPTYFRLVQEVPMTAYPYEGSLQQAIDLAEIAQTYEFDAYQDFTDSTAIYPEANSTEYLMLGLVSEVRELAGKLKKELRDGTVVTNDDFTKQLGDVLWYVAQLASDRNMFFSDIANKNVNKLKDRMERDTLKGSGDDR